MTYNADRAADKILNKSRANGNGSARPRQHIWTSEELLATKFPEPRYVVPGILPEGLSILAGRPKLGKSWLMFDWAVAITSEGFALGSIQCEMADALILSLEDSPRRVQDRLRKLGALGNPHLVVATYWPRSDEGGLDQLNDYLEQNRDCRYVVADTLAKVRPRTSRMRDAYQADVAAIEPMQQLANERNIAICVATHTRKAPAEDWLDAVGGTSGITGTADSIVVLKRERGQADAFLLGDGRDMPEFEKPLRFDAGRWKLLDMSAEEARATSDQTAIIALLRQMGGAGLMRSQIAAALDRSKQAVSNMLARMEAAGIVERSKDSSFWRLTV